MRPVVLYIVATTLWATNTAFAKPSFRSYELESDCKDLCFADLDGNGLDDVIIVNPPTLMVFLQDPKQGFAKQPDHLYSLKNKPAIIWPARLGHRPGQDILVMTHEGVDALTFANKTSPPEKRRLIRQPTILPETCDDPTILLLPLSANTLRTAPLIMVPTEDALQLWKYDRTWQHSASLPDKPDTRIWGPHGSVGYVKQHLLNLNIGDLNYDQTDDIVICDHNNDKVALRIYAQAKDGSFPAEPTQSYTYEWDWRTWTCLWDINRDGRVDVFRNTHLHEPGFVPGMGSGKVVVQMFLADAQGQFPQQARTLFRKSDWTPSMPIVDIDGDGYIDLVLGYGQFDTREGFRKTITTKTLSHVLRFHFYRANGFAKQPDAESRIAIQLDDRGHLFSAFSPRFDLVKHRVSLEGDFNGDGKRDLLVKDKEKKASVYCFVSRKKGFSKRATLSFPVKRVQRFAVEDLNHDRISDLVVLDDTASVFLSRKK